MGQEEKWSAFAGLSRGLLWSTFQDDKPVLHHHAFTKQ